MMWICIYIHMYIYIYIYICVYTNLISMYNYDFTANKRGIISISSRAQQNSIAQLKQETDS